MLLSYTIKHEEESYNELPYAYELWPIDRRTMSVNIGGDFGVFIFKKVKD